MKRHRGLAKCTFLFLTVLFMLVLSRPTSCLAAPYTDSGDGTVTDTGTGLMWQKADDGTVRSWSDASTYCDNMVVGGYEDWRIPRVDELTTIADYSRYSPAIDPAFQSKPSYYWYWSSSTYAGNTGSAWGVYFDNGSTNEYNKSSTHYVRCVRGGPFWSFDPSIILQSNTTNTVKDIYRGYIWQKSEDGVVRTWDAAKSYCDALALDGYSDWRIPTIQEIQTIIDYSAYNPALSTEVLQGRPYYYWSGSTFTVNTDGAWFVYFNNGYTNADWKSGPRYVRCVRGGPSGSFGNLIISKSGSGTGTVTSSPAGINCGTDCTEQYTSGTSVTLASTANAGSKFTGWSGGGCSGTETCTITMDSDVTVTTTFEPDLHSISGTVKIGTSSGSPLSGAAMSLTGAATKSASTDTSGNFSFAGLLNGSYTLTPSKDLYDFSPVNRMFNIGGADVTGQDFVATLQTGSLTATVSPADAITAGAQWQVDGGAWKNSGDIVSDLVVGSHSVVFKSLDGWDTPSSQAVTITKGQTTDITGTYNRHLGSLTVTISPPEAVAAGAQWQVDGGNWQVSGATVQNLPTSSHTVTFNTIPKWNSPSPLSITVSKGQTTTGTGTYEQQKGSLTVTISPSDAVTAGAQWKVDSGTWQASGATQTGIPVGDHTLSFKDITNWTTPSSRTVSISYNQTAIATGTYIRHAGSLSVTLMPQQAIAAGAQWKLDTGEWQNSGITLSDIPVGQHTVTFKDLAGWTTPAPQSVTIQKDLPTTSTGVFIQQTGSLTVALTPQKAIDAGAMWQLDGGEWRSSGGTLTDIPVGQHTVAFKEINGWSPPSTQTVTIQKDQTTTAQGDYVQRVGALLAGLSPQQAIDSGAQWQIDGGEWKASGVAVSDIPVGSHTVTFKAISNWNSPPSQTVNILEGETAKVTGTYELQRGSLLVTILPQNAVNEGAQWKLDAGEWVDSGATVGGIPVGSHTVSFKDVAGWPTPSSQTVLIENAKITTATGNYTRQTSLTVTISPPEAITSGAQWAVDAGQWQNSGVSVIGLSIGQHVIKFKDVTGWTPPKSQNVIVENGKAATATGEYTKATGSLTVAITPQEAVVAGAQWNVDDEAWQNSGASVSGLSASQHVVKFKEITGWTTPSSQTVSIEAGKTASLTGVYVKKPDPPVAELSASPTSGSAPLAVSFKTLATGEITSWLWSFGDGGSSTLQSPTYTYKAEGTYPVSLTVTGPGGTDTETKEGFIQVSAPVQYTLTVEKTGTGTGLISSNPAGITCGDDCLERYVSGTSITLTARTNLDSTFTGWSGGGCTGTAPCTITLTQDATITASFTKKEVLKPDLIMTEVSGPATGLVWRSIQVKNTVKNQGKKLAGKLAVGIYLSEDELINSKTDILLATRLRPSLKVEESSSASTSLVIPANVVPGTYFLGAMADVKDKVNESDEANNTMVSSQRIEINSPQPDLVVTDVTSPATGKIGDKVRLFAGFKNQGMADAKKAFKVGVYLSKDATLDATADTFLGYMGVSTLKAGGTVRREMQVKIPTGIQPGPFYFIAHADKDDVIPESDEENNTKASPATIQLVK